MQIKTPIQKQPNSHLDEQILVVKRSFLFPNEDSAWHGVNQKVFNELFETVKAHKEFQPRSLMETDPTYKQIIPYLVFRYDTRYFLMQRRAGAGEQRLKNKYTLGIGGHIREEDLSSDDIMGWAEREFNEEVSYEGGYTVRPLGILNDDTNPVGQVHLGFALLVEGTSSSIAIRSELKSGQLYSLDRCAQFYDRMEGWSQKIFDCIMSEVSKE